MYSDIKKTIERGGELLILNKRGMVVALPISEKENFERLGRENLMPADPPQSIRELADVGILVFDNYRPAAETTARFDDALMKAEGGEPIYPAPILAHFSVTNRCNMRCAYCSVRRLNERQADLDTTGCKKIIERLSQWGVFQIGFTGGEPSLRRDLPELIAYTVSLGNACNLTTNGWLLDERMVQAYRRAGLEQAQVSLDSHVPEVHDRLRGRGSFARAVKAIKLMQANGIAVGVDCVVSRNNIGTIMDFITFLEHLKIPGLTLIKIKQGDLELEKFKSLCPDYDEYSRLIDAVCRRKNINPEVTIDCGSVSNLQATLTDTEMEKLHAAGCPAGLNLISVSANGDLYPCAALAAEKHVLGNILTDDLQQIWFEHKLLRNLRDIKNIITGSCKECARLDSCRGGCRGIAESLTGLWTSDPDCQRNKNN